MASFNFQPSLADAAVSLRPLCAADFRALYAASIDGQIVPHVIYAIDRAGFANGPLST